MRQRMTVLYQVSGACFPLLEDEWTEVLAAARAAGWVPKRTSAPPVNGKGGQVPPWDGSYEPARGQEVTRADAASLAAALARTGGGGWRSALAEFAARGGFIVCRGDSTLGEVSFRIEGRTGAGKLNSGDTIGRRADLRGTGTAGIEPPIGAFGTRRGGR